MENMISLSDNTHNEGINCKNGIIIYHCCRSKEMLQNIFVQIWLPFTLFGLATTPIQSRSADLSKIETAVSTVESLCLSGTEYGISADAKGNITIKSFKPKGSASLTFNARESKGSSALQKDLRIIGDQDVRECTQKHIGRILDAIFESTPSVNGELGKSVCINKYSSAKFLGYVPNEVEIQDFVEGETQLYYRFSVKQPASVKIGFIKNSQRLSMVLVTAKEMSIASGSYSSGRETETHFLMPGDYYVIVKCYNKKHATAFKMKIEAAV